MTTRTAVVSIGRNVGPDPMSLGRWLKFQVLTRQALKARGEIHFDGLGHGVYEGIPEDSRTYIASLPVDHLDRLRASLRELADLFDQDSIALTVGETEFLTGRPFAS